MAAKKQSKFEKTMADLFGKIDSLEGVIKQKPVTVKEGDQDAFKLLREQHDAQFNEIRTEFNALKEAIDKPRRTIESTNFSLFDFLFKI